MLAQLLEKHGLSVRTLPHEAVSRAQIGTLDARDVGVVCISYLDISGSPAHLRFLIRRIRQRLPSASILVGIWAAADPFLRDQGSRQAMGADYYVGSLRETLDACLVESRKAAEVALPRHARLELVAQAGSKEPQG